MIQTAFWGLLFTIFLEVLIVILLGFRDKKSIISVVCINLISHPIFTSLLFLHMMFGYVFGQFIFIIILEIIIFVCEAVLLMYALRWNAYKAFKVSFFINAVSCVVGSIIFTGIMSIFYLV